MNLKDQVLSIAQVRELQELGFDVNKHSSLKSNGKQIIVQDDFYIGGAPLFPTMTIGDIIDILPTFIEIGSSKITYKLGINNSNIQYFNNNDIFIRCYGGNTLIDALFKTLKWCIKEKHIAL